MIHVIYSPIFFRVVLLELRQSNDCPITSEVDLKDMGEIDLCERIAEHILYVEVHKILPCRR